MFKRLERSALGLSFTASSPRRQTQLTLPSALPRSLGQMPVPYGGHRVTSDGSTRNFVCVCERESRCCEECVRERESKIESVCGRERESVCVCV